MLKSVKRKLSRDHGCRIAYSNKFSGLSVMNRVEAEIHGLFFL